MNIFITGASGYVARHLVPMLREEGHRLIGLDRVAPVDSGVFDHFYQCDLLDVTIYENALKDVDQVCHLAAAKGDWGISDAEYFRDNLDATRALLNVAKKAHVHNWIFYSTVSALGPSAEPLPETAPHNPINAYGASKSQCEALFDAYLEREPKAHVITIRPSVIFGPGNPWNTNIFRLIDAIHHSRFVMIGHGDAVKTTSFLQNLLRAHLFLLNKQLDYPMTGHHIYHYVDEPGWTTSQIVAMIYKALGRKQNKLHLPLSLAAPLALVGDGLAAISGKDIPITSARVRKFCTATNFSADAIRDLGFRQPLSNESAITQTVHWYLNDYLGR